MTTQLVQKVHVNGVIVHSTYSLGISLSIHVSRLEQSNFKTQQPARLGLLFLFPLPLNTRNANYDNMLIFNTRHRVDPLKLSFLFITSIATERDFHYKTERVVKVRYLQFNTFKCQVSFFFSLNSVYVEGDFNNGY